MTNDNIAGIIESLEELKEDSTVPKNVKTKIQEIIKYLGSEKEELSIRINKALNVLDEISDDNNLQTYTRTQVWNIVSALEMV